jgi:phosphoribosylformylglycinamidine cyclo-ligase
MSANTYKKSGVDIDAAASAKNEMARFIDRGDGRVLNKVGAFASLFDFSFPDIKEPVLVLKTEEPGSKQKLSIAYGKIESICYDMINHLTNDILVMGATPLAVQDAIICGKLEKNVVSRLVKYISQACIDNGSVLTGGETSEQPNVLEAGVYVLTSSIVGVVEKSKIIDGGKISEGDAVIALASNGIHTNGYSFLRMLMSGDKKLADKLIDGEKFIDVILRPHRSYYKELTPLFDDKNLKAMAHITGGGIAGNLNRVLNENQSALIDLGKIEALPIFRYIKSISGAEDSELLKTFNMGVGMTLVVKKEAADAFITHFKRHNLNAYVIGSIIKGNKKVEFENKLNF